MLRGLNRYSLVAVTLGYISMVTPQPANI